MGAPPIGQVTDAARSAIQNFLKARPNVQLPPHLEKLRGTHGMFLGDGRKEREVVIGWKPSFVLFVVPVFPDGVPRPGANGYWRPDLHAQPPYTEKGFVVTEAFNKPGEMHIFVAWKSA